MPADLMEKSSSSPVAATPASVHATPDKPRTASDHRKSSKPIMEKRRRARINESLGQLKTLILDALKKDSSRHSKLEKADILEMTVKHLRNMQRAQMTAALNTDPSVLGKYRAGFSECMNEVTHFLSTCEGVDTEVRTRLLGHLASCMSQINAMNFAAALPPPPPPRAPAQRLPGAAPGAGPGGRSSPHRQPRRRQGEEHQGVRGLPAAVGLGRALCLPHPQHGLCAPRQRCPPPLRQWGPGLGAARCRQGPLTACSGLCLETLVKAPGSSLRTLDCGAGPFGALASRRRFLLPFAQGS
ncbi:hypothetical protein lerEdw1_005096 [Lerista edwardsae]|nr:hypothetical protein lerEdw1_005096 [Lerista edwardsae]